MLPEVLGGGHGLTLPAPERRNESPPAAISGAFRYWDAARGLVPHCHSEKLQSNVENGIERDHGAGEE